MVVPTGPWTLPRRTSTSGWDRLRWCLVVAWLLVAAGALAFGEQASSRGTLDEGLRSGRVEEVRVTGHEVHWRDGMVRRWYEVRQVRDGASLPGGDLRTGNGKLAAELAQAYPDVRVVRVERASSRTWLGDWRVPGWVAPLVLVATVPAFFLLVKGPQPWRATRWAWFWLLSTPVGMVAFLLLSGPTAPLPAPHDPRRRLTGGWAFLLAGLLGAGLGAWY